MRYFIIRSISINRDSRITRYEKIISKPGLFHYITLENIYNNDFLKIVNYIWFILKLFSLCLIFKRGDVIICMDLDTFIPVWLTNFFRKKIFIYLDIVDPISETKFRNLPRFLRYFFDHIEYFLLKYRQLNILPSEWRKYYYKEKLNKDVSCLNFNVVENIPINNNIFMYVIDKKFPLNKGKIVIGYFGTLERERGLLELINFLQNFNDHIQLLVGGRGSLKNEIISMCQKDKKINFIGSFTPNDLPMLYKKIDFIWAYYKITEEILHYKYACPNKFYEHLIFYTPIIINEGVYVSRFVNNYKTGIVIKNHLSNDVLINLVEELSCFSYDIKNFETLRNKYINYSIKIP